jgi:hypothetical protein
MAKVIGPAMLIDLNEKIGTVVWASIENNVLRH